MKIITLPREAVFEGSMILVNGQHPIREQKTAPDLVSLNDSEPDILMERRAGTLLCSLMESIGGWKKIAAVSGWRSIYEQGEIWNHSIKENGKTFTQKYVALPGHSEHQTGLAIDLGLRQPEIDFIRPDFPYTGICRTFRKKAPLFGFVERYPAEGEKITGIAHEPWHFRYVGVPHASIMFEQGLTLEEYHSFIRKFTHGVKSCEYEKNGICAYVSYLAASGDITEIEINADAPYSISGNNSDGFVITQWRGRHGIEDLWGT